MLSAILNGKRRGTGISGDGQLSTDGATGSEDALTAIVFGRIGYLPTEVFDNFMTCLLECEESPGLLEKMEFWPSWNQGNGRVEPDVFLRCSEGDVIVEAKRYDYVSQQDASQLKREIEGYRKSERPNKKVFLLAVGGLEDYSNETKAALQQQLKDALDSSAGDWQLVCRSWKDVLRCLNDAIKKENDVSVTPLQRLIGDIAYAYDWHGIRAGEMRWLSDLEAKRVDMQSLSPFFDFVKEKPSILPVRQLKQRLSELQVSRIHFTHFPFLYGGSK